MKRTTGNTIIEFTETWRISRVVMMTFVTVSAAYGFRADPSKLPLTAVCAFFLALGGFYMDHLSDADNDKKSGRKRNPVATGLLPKKAGVAVVGISLAVSAAAGYLVNPWTLLPLGSVILILSGLASGVLNRPFLKAFSLGALQALYALIGGLASGRFEPAMAMSALFLFFAMTGGRVLGDVRDLPYDRRTRSDTIPTRYGTGFSVAFYLIFEIASYVVGLGSYLTKYFGIGYLVCMVLTAVVGSALSVYFVLKPVPRRADTANRLSLMILGTLYAVGMLTGRLG